MSRHDLRIYVCTDRSGLSTGRVMARAHAAVTFVAAGRNDEEVLERLHAQISLALDEQPEVLEAFAWTEDVSMAKVLVEIRPQTTIAKRTVIGKDRIPITLSYAWAPLEREKHEKKAGAGFRVMLPRFGWWFVVEDLGMAAEVLRSAVGAELVGQSSRSVFEFREVVDERVLEWRPRFSKKTRSAEDPTLLRFPAVSQVSEEWVSLVRAGKLGAHYGPVDLTRTARLAQLAKKPSILLVGPPGVGKTEWVRDLARRLANANSDSRLWATSADRIMAGMQYLGMWEKRCLDLVAELSGEGHWLYVDRLTALAETRSGASSIADLLLPALAEGELALIAECTEEELARLSVEAPTLLACFQLVRLAPPTPEEMAVMVHERQERKSSNDRFAPDAVRRLLRHLRLFRKDHELPGKAFLFLDWLDKRARKAPRTLGLRDADRLFCQYSGLPEQLVSDSEVADATVLGAILSERVIGQPDACRLSAEVLARFKAGVNDPDKPIGSLLFVGPTGVGKTELAKQLARFVFGSSDRMIRLDMSEYMLASSTSRLFSELRGADSLAQRVSREPLCLVLLDEIEKAHPAVFDAFLGILGEGRLTSESGRLVDFRMTLIVMTSNLGVGAAELGFGRHGADPRQAQSAVRAHFRPEFVNRLDHVIPFRELDPESLRRIVDLELLALTEREGFTRRNLALFVSDEAKQLLAELGHHPKFGARPLKRVIEEQVMTPLAIELARRPKLRDLRVQVRVETGQLRVELEPNR